MPILAGDESSSSLLRLPLWEEHIVSALPSGGESLHDWRVVCFREVTSTMDMCRIILSSIQEDSSKHPDNANSFALCVLAQSQSMGRGRQGRKWQSMDGNLLCSIAFHWDQPLSKLVGFSLAFGVMLAESLAGIGIDIRLKWPNDLVFSDHRKVGGILVELENSMNSSEVGNLQDSKHARSDRRMSVIAGLGLNLISPPQEGVRGATLAELCPQANQHLLTPDAFMAYLLPRLSKGIAEFRECGFLAFRARWLGYNWAQGSEVEVAVVEVGGANEPVRGTVIGIDESGSLLLKTTTGLRAISAGDVNVIA